MPQHQGKNSLLLGHLACFAAYAIFGFNIIFCKDMANEGGIAPIALFTFRALVAGLLFWILSLFTPKERVEKKDFPKIVLASLLGLFVPQLTFLKAITITTPIDLAVLNTLAPIMTMFIAAVVLKEPITWKKAGGVAVSFVGVLLFIFQTTSRSGSVEVSQPLGIALVLLNSVSFASYLGIFRPLISKYNVVTFMKWMFLVAFVVSLPLSWSSIWAVDYGAISMKAWWELGFLIIFATFFAYFLIPYGQQRLRPTLVSMYGYLQPIIAAVGSILVGLDRLTVGKVGATILVVLGVALVNKSRSAESSPQEKN